jgi:tetratricopeptide (TPR) repeat protein
MGLALMTAQAWAQGTRWQDYMAEGARAFQEGDDTEAEMWYLAALQDVEGLGAEDPRLATTLNALAVFYHARNKYDAAAPLYQRVLAILEQTLEPEHPTLATTLNNLAVLYEAQGKFAAAEPLYRRALAILEKALGPEHPNLAAGLENYADLLRKSQRHAEADLMEARAKAIWAKQAQRPPER